MTYKVSAGVSRTGMGSDVGPRPPEFKGMPDDNKAPTVTGYDTYLADVSGLLSGQNDYTAEMWICPGLDNDKLAGDYLLHRGPSSPTIKGDFWGVNSDATTKEYTNLCFDDGTSGVAGSTTLVTGQWYHLAMVRDGDDVTLYLNGIEELSATMPASNNFADGKWAFGGRLDLGQQRFAGNIDEIAIYGRVLSEAEIFSHYSMGVLPEPSTWILLAVGGLGLAACRGRKKTPRPAVRQEVERLPTQ